MAELKTKKTEQSVEDFLNQIADEKKRRDSFTLLELMRKETGGEPKMWGPSIIGFGDYRYKYPDGREMDWFLAGFSPRKQNLALYLFSGYERDEELMKKLGKYKTGKSCLYLKKLEDVELTTLRELVRESVAQIKRKAKD